MLESLLVSSPDSWLVLDTRLHVVEANAPLLGLLGRSREAVIGQPWASLFPHLIEIGHEGSLRTVLDGGAPMRSRLPIPGRGREVPHLLDVLTYSVRDPHTGEITHLVETGREITAEVRLQLEIADANRELIAAKERLEAKAREIHAVNSQLEERCTILEAVNLHLERVSVLDVMTDLPNHRAFQEQLGYQISQWQRHGRPFTLVMFDVDNFKQYNDRYGHQPGDTVLAQVARLTRECARAVDRPARYGGEEFAIILPETNKAGAAQVAERLRGTVASFAFEHGPITISIGVAEFPTDAKNGADLIQRADQAMYGAKRDGRNAVRVWETPGAGAPAMAAAQQPIPIF